MPIIKFVSTVRANKYVLGEIDAIGRQFVEIIFDLGIIHDLFFVAGSILVALPHPGGVGMGRENHTEASQKIHEPAGHVLIAVLVAKDHQAGNLVFNDHLLMYRIGIFQRIEPFNNELHQMRMVAPIDRRRKDHNVGGKNTTVVRWALHSRNLG